ncbi:MAG: hypothetical protein JW776_15910 [Candidatus Lokiarchaeota archaeon]|nr:hypothetical protein [Candidatus Lokiarchaeota archaeon]
MAELVPEFNMTTLLQQAVYQQLFLSKDKIMGRMPQNVMQFKDVGFLLDTFIESIYDQIDLLNPDEIDRFLLYFENLFSMNLSHVREQILKNFEGMGDLHNQNLIVIYMVLTKLLENAREQAYKRYGLNRIKKTFEKQSKNEFKEVKEDFQLLAQTSDKSISLLYNLCFIRLLAETFDKEKRILTNAKRQITHKINEVLEKLSK